MTRLKLMGAGQWLSHRHVQVLDRAYQAAQEIRSLEDQYCQGQPITDEAKIGKTVYDYVRSLCDRKLLTVRNNLAQFKVNSFLLGQPPLASANGTTPNANNVTNAAKEITDNSLIQKLSFIESVISRYRDPFHLETANLSEQPRSRPAKTTDPLPIDGPPLDLEAGSTATQGTDPALLQFEVAAEDLARPGLFGSFSLNRKQTKQYEQKVVQELRQRQQQSKSALRWLAVLLAVPILIAVLAKALVFGPALGNYSDTNPTAVQLNEEIRTEFSAHLTEFKEEIEIRELLNLTPKLAPEEKQKQLAEKASELWREAREEELNGLKNVLSDSVAMLVFIALVFFNRRRLTVIRAFSNRAFLSLSDPIKIFFFILITDMFVGFHSAEGWDAILTGVTVHFGLPEHPNAIKIFIATIPVMMDSFIKFWIFNYLTRFSPASSAIFERMNS